MEFDEKKLKYLLVAVSAFFAGMVGGFLISPIKKGVGNNSGNVKNYYGTASEEEEEE